MVDWLTCRVPVSLAAPIADGHTIELDANGEIRRCTPHRLKVPGSFSSSLLVRAVGLDELEIQGNPAKWLAGHNLWGVDCPVKLLRATLDRLWGLLGLDPALVLHGHLSALQGVIFTRIDLTAMFELGSRADVLTWLRTAQHQASIPHRGRGVFREGSLVLGSAKGKAFTRWQVVCYSKGQEVAAHPLPEPVVSDEQLSAWTDRQLRIEVRLGRHELTETGRRSVSGWEGEGMSAKVYSEKIGLISFQATDDFDLTLLSTRAQFTFRAWRDGADLRTMLSQPTFYRHRSEIRTALGVDINIPPAPKPGANVVPLQRVLEARPVGRPDFADRIDALLRAAAA